MSHSHKSLFTTVGTHLISFSSDSSKKPFYTQIHCRASCVWVGFFQNGFSILVAHCCKDNVPHGTAAQMVVPAFTEWLLITTLTQFPHGTVSPAQGSPQTRTSLPQRWLRLHRELCPFVKVSQQGTERSPGLPQCFGTSASIPFLPERVSEGC